MDARPGWQPLRSQAGASGDAVALPSAFSRLVAAQALSCAGDTLVAVALAGSLFFDISPAAARTRVALSLVLTMAPFAIVAPFLGPAIDRRRNGRRGTLVSAAAGRVLTCLVMARYLHGLLLFPVAFGSLVLSKAFGVAKSSLVPTTIADQDDLIQANAKLAITAAVVGLASAAPGILVLKTVGAPWVLRLAAAVLVAAAVAAGRVEQVSPDAGDGGAAAVEALHEAALRPAVLGTAALRASVGFVTFATAFSLRRGGAPSWVFGLVLAASMAGSFGGAVVAPHLRRVVREERVLVLSLLAVAGTALVCSRWASRFTAGVLALVLGACASAGKLAFDSLVQRDAPAAVQGRQFARFEAAFQIVWVIGALVPTVVPIPLRVAFVIVGLVAAGAAVLPELQRRRNRS